MNEEFFVITNFKETLITSLIAVWGVGRGPTQNHFGFPYILGNAIYSVFPYVSPKKTDTGKR